ncbi:hypothetical protein MTO96_042248, partial [Rhipicephalus appendiculatus]
AESTRVDNLNMNIEVTYPRTARTYCSRNDINPVAATERILGALDTDSEAFFSIFQRPYPCDEEVAPPVRKYRLVAVTTQTHVDITKRLLALVQKEFRTWYPQYGAQVELPADPAN